MQYKTKINIDVPCPLCKRTDVKHHAKGLCNACYHRPVKKRDQMPVESPKSELSPEGADTPLAKRTV